MNLNMVLGTEAQGRPLSSWTCWELLFRNSRVYLLTKGLIKQIIKGKEGRLKRSINRTRALEGGPVFLPRLQGVLTGEQSGHLLEVPGAWPASQME